MSSCASEIEKGCTLPKTRENAEAARTCHRAAVPDTGFKETLRAHRLKAPYSTPRPSSAIHRNDCVDIHMHGAYCGRLMHLNHT